jgi:hypothetical protein
MCTSPIQGWRAKFVNRETGKRPIVFNRKHGFSDLPVKVPCGRCWQCRLEHSRQWAIRCVHESQMHEHNAFITLTFNEENLPDDHSIRKEHLQKFFKRLRKHLGVDIRYFACGEYGKQNNRPHYHAIIFGYDFPDKYLFSKSRNGDLYFRSPTLEKAWKFGHSVIGNMTFESAAYVARYVMKKRKGDQDEIDEYYKLLDTETGEVHQLEPEFCLMSRRPGIGKTWLEKFKSDTDKDFITIRGKKMSLPKYYDNLLEQLGEDLQDRKLKRMQSVNKEDQTLARGRIKDKVLRAKTQTLHRNLEDFIHET